MEILNFILEDGLIMMPALYIIAEIIKGTELFKHKYLPLIILVLSLVITPLILEGGYVAENLIQAILVAGTTVYSNQVVKQLGKDE